MNKMHFYFLQDAFIIEALLGNYVNIEPMQDDILFIFRKNVTR